MSDSDADNDRPEPKTVRSSKDIKAGLLKEVWMTEGAAQRISQILAHHAKSVTMPAGHQHSLHATIPHQDPALMRQNWRNFLEGRNSQFSSSDYVDAPGRAAAAAAALKDSGHLKDSEIYKIYQEIREAEKHNPLAAPEILMQYGDLLNILTPHEAPKNGIKPYVEDAPEPVPFVDARLAPEDMPPLDFPNAVTNADLDYAARSDIHDAYMDDDYTDKNDPDRLRDEIFATGPYEDSPEQSKSIPDIDRLFNDKSQLNYTGQDDIHAPYQDEVFTKTSNTTKISLENAAPEVEYIQTMLDYTGYSDVQTPYADQFFNAARWPELPPESAEREHLRQQLLETYGDELGKAYGDAHITIPKPKLN